MSELSTQLDSAYEALYQGDLDAAKRGLDAARRLAQSSTEVLLLEVDLLDAEGLHDEAFAVLEQDERRLRSDLALGFRYATLLLDAADDPFGARPVLEDIHARLEQGDKPIEIETDEDREESDSFALEVALTLSDVRATTGDPQGALILAQLATKRAPKDPITHIILATAHYDLGQLEEANSAIADARKIDSRMPDALWLQGRIETFRGKYEAASKLFEEACELDPDRFVPPLHVSDEEFANAQLAAIAELPGDLADFAARCQITKSEVPTKEQLQRTNPPTSPGSLGLCLTDPVAKSDSPWANPPCEIVLFLKNLEVSSSAPEELVEQIGNTIAQEIAFYLDLEDEDIF